MPSAARVCPPPAEPARGPIPGVGAVLGVVLLCVAGAAHPADPFDRLSWLAGCWHKEGAPAGSGEQWTSPAGGTLLGISRTVDRGATVDVTFMQIRQQPDGRLLYLSQPTGMPEAAYALQPGPATELSFEAGERDFPQRYVYRLEAAGRLRLRVEGQRNGEPLAVETMLLRKACETQPAPETAFQGLPWGADEAQIALRFGPRLQQADCEGTSRQAAPAPVCKAQQLTPYEVAGIPFRLELRLDDGTRQLVRVRLSWSGDADAAPENGWGEKHRLLRQLLTQRYGAAESSHVANDPGIWTASARWRQGATLIELSSIYRPRTATVAAREQVEIVYQPVTAGEAGKL